MKEILEEVARSCSPDVIIAPSSDDAHQDHRTIGEIVPTVFRDQLYLAYEIPKWDGDLGRPSMYVPLSAEIARRKVELLHKCFPSQRGRDWWDDEVFLGLARLRGMECRARYAEAFTCTKVSDRPARVRAPVNPTGEGPYMNISVDPDVPCDELRQQLYAGNLVILTRLQALTDSWSTRARNSPSCSGRTIRNTSTSTSIRRRWPRSWALGSRASSTRNESRKLVRAIIPRPGSRLKARTTTCPSRGRPSRRAPYDRRCLRLPVASRRLVQRARPADQLVASRLPGARQTTP